ERRRPDPLGPAADHRRARIGRGAGALDPAAGADHPLLRRLDAGVHRQLPRALDAAVPGPAAAVPPADGRHARADALGDDEPAYRAQPRDVEGVAEEPHRQRRPEARPGPARAGQARPLIPIRGAQPPAPRPRAAAPLRSTPTDSPWTSEPPSRPAALAGSAPPAASRSPAPAAAWWPPTWAATGNASTASCAGSRGWTCASANSTPPISTPVAPSSRRSRRRAK